LPQVDFPARSAEGEEELTDALTTKRSIRRRSLPAQGAAEEKT